MKKTLAAILAILLIPLINVVPSFAGETVTVTDAELIVNNYPSLTEGERAVILSSYVDSASYTYAAPRNGIITVDAKNKKVSAPDFTSDLTWRPTACRVVSADGVEKVPVIDGEASFTYAGNAYTVEVDYAADVYVDEKVQRRLLGGAWALASAKDSADTIDAYANYYSLIASNTAVFVKMTDPSYAGSYTVTDPETVAAIGRLNEQSERNSGFLDIELKIYEYEEAPSKIGFILDDGAALSAFARQTFSDISAVNNDPSVKSVLKNVIGRNTPSGKKAQIALNAITSLINGVEDASMNDWAILDAEKNPLKSGLTTDDYIALDELVDGAMGAEYHDDAIVNPLKTRTVTVMANVNQFNVSVVLRASYIAGTTIDSAEATPLEDHTTVIQVLEGSTPAQVEEAVAASGIEDAALSSWVDIDGTNYDRTASDLPANLAEDTEYTITYSPKMINVAYGFETELPAAVPYGYNMTLPLNENAELVYDYEIDGRAYLQGDVYRVTKSVTVNRTEGKPWNVSKLNTIVADVYAEDLTDAEESALRAVALKGENVLFRIPTNDDGLVTVTANGGGNFTVTASDYPSGIPGVVWRAVSGLAVKNGETAGEFTFTNGSAFIGSDDFDRIEVKYAATLTNISDDTIVAVLNTPSLLAKNVKEIKKNVDTLDSLYDQFAKLDQSSLKTIQIGVNGSEMGDDAKAAADFIVENCVNKSTSRLYLFEYLTDYRERGAALLFSDSIYESISRQTKYLTDSLNVMNDDPELLPLLTDIGYEDYSERINEILRILNDVEFPPLPDGIDGSASDIDLLTDALLAVDTGRAYDAANRPLTLTANVIEWTSRKVTVTLDGVVFGNFDAGSKVELPALESITELGVTARFFTWSGADVIMGNYDPESSSPNKRSYSLLLGGGDVNLSSVFVYLGDVNNDGLITIQDIAAAKKLLAGNEGFDDINLEALDIDGNGLTVIRDLGLLKKLIAG